MERRNYWRRRRCSGCKKKFWVRLCYSRRIGGGRFCSAKCKYNTWRGTRRSAQCPVGHVRGETDLYSKGTCKRCTINSSKKSYATNPKEKRAYRNAFSAKLKLEVLTHYSPHGNLRCSWRGCNITDIDMLSLDHVHDDGFKHLNKHGKRYGSGSMYTEVRIKGFPDGFQTLCGVQSRAHG
jgi:hypothetical protein